MEQLVVSTQVGPRVTARAATTDAASAIPTVDETLVRPPALGLG